MTGNKIRVYFSYNIDPNSVKDISDFVMLDEFTNINDARTFIFEDSELYSKAHNYFDEHDYNMHSFKYMNYYFNSVVRVKNGMWWITRHF